MNLQAVLLAVVLASVSCTTTQQQTEKHGPKAWVVEETEIALYHSSTVDPGSGFVAHVEYCAARLSAGPNVLHIVYRPIDFPNRNPGFAKGDTLVLTGLDKAKDFGAMDGKDYWIHEIGITKPVNKSDAGDGK